MEEFFKENMDTLLSIAGQILNSTGPCDASIEPGDLVNNLFLWFWEKPSRWDNVKHPMAYCRKALRTNALALKRRATNNGHLSEAYVCPAGAPDGGWPGRVSDTTEQTDERILVDQLRAEFPYVGRALDNGWHWQDWNRAYVFRRREQIQGWVEG